MHRALQQIARRFAFTSKKRKEFVRLRWMLFRHRMSRRRYPVGLGTLPAAARFERKVANPHAILIHMSHGPGSHQCACECPDGPCEHKWDGVPEEGDTYHSATCSRCGKSAISHDMWVF